MNPDSDNIQPCVAFCNSDDVFATRELQARMNRCTGGELKPPAIILPDMYIPAVETRTIQSWEEMRQTEDFLSAELNRLTVQERAKAQDDLHCVGEELIETTEMVENVLEEFDGLVKEMQNPVYNKACQQNSAYVEDPSFRLRFLRCNLYDVRRSVGQMMEFLRYKAAYFGEDKLAQEITLDDLNDEDMDLMLSGLYHIQEERDRSGRVIVANLWDKIGRGIKLENLIHVAYYVVNCVLLPMLEVQMKGICFIFYDLKTPGENYVAPGLNFFLSACTVWTTFPIRHSAVHLCLKPARGNLAFTNKLLRNSLNLVSSYSRVRTRLHYGTDIEVQYYLRSHGVPTQSFPVDLDGKERWNILNAWFYNKHSREEIEAQKQPGLNLSEHASSQRTDGKPASVAAVAGEDAARSEEQGRPNQRSQREPSKQDVLLGRGWKIQNHEGNKRFRTFLVAYGDEYDRAPRLQKREIARRCVRELRTQGVRFWKQIEDFTWVESTMDEAENKVGQMFRTIRKNSKS